MITQKLISSVLTLSFLVPSIAFAQDSPQGANDRREATFVQESYISSLVREAQLHFEKGESAYRESNFDDARAEFDLAIDTILKAGLDLRQTPRLRTYFQGLISKINALEVMARSNGEAVSEQPYEPSLHDELAEVELDNDDLAAGEGAGERPSLDFTFTLTPQIRQFVHYFSQNPRGRATMQSGLQRAGRYLPLARKIFQEEGVPLDLVWLGQAESNWRPKARSWANAVGLWQFISSRGAEYGLRQNKWIDERSSFEQATRASARYLKFLHNRFLDWQLAMAGYNCGEGRVDKAIATTGYADFWYIYNRRLLPAETRNYVPIIIAIIIIAKNPEEYGFNNVIPDPPLKYDIVTVEDSIDLRLVAELTNAPYEIIEELNPELKRGVTPPDMEYSLRLPQGTEESFTTLIARIPEESLDSWRVIRINTGETLESLAKLHEIDAHLIARVNNHEPGEMLKPGTPLVLPVELARAPLRGRVDNPPVQIARRSSRRTSITVKSGDTLTRIAARYGVSVRELARINRISVRAKIRVGQRLHIDVPSAQVSRTSSKGQTNPQSYRVRRGDTLGGIARRFGISVSDLRTWNRLTSDKIFAGQQLTLTPRGKTKVGRTSKQQATHRVRRNETLSSIATRYGVSVQQIKTANRLRSDKIMVGQRLTIPR